MTELVTMDSRPERQIFSGTYFAKAEIDAAMVLVPALQIKADAAWQRLQQGWASKNMVEIKLACEELHAAELGLEQIARQVGALAGSLARTFTAHINRRQW
jgi:hypothetical protein